MAVPLKRFWYQDSFLEVFANKGLELGLGQRNRDEGKLRLEVVPAV